MSLILLLRGAVTSPGVVDSGTASVESATLILGIPVAVSDIIRGADNSSLQVPVPAAEVLPKLTLEVSFDAQSGPIYREAVVTAPAKVYYRLNELSGPAIDRMGNVNLSVVGSVTRGVTTMVPGE